MHKNCFKNPVTDLVKLTEIIFRQYGNGEKVNIDAVPQIPYENRYNTNILQ